MPEWRNGRRGGLKILWGQPHVGSTPTSGTSVLPIENTVREIVFCSTMSAEDRWSILLEWDGETR